MLWILFYVFGLSAIAFTLIYFLPIGVLNNNAHDTFVVANESLTPSSLRSNSPTIFPSMNPRYSPTLSPTLNPSVSPTVSPTQSPSVSPTVSPSPFPTESPSISPTISPIKSPSTVVKVTNRYTISGAASEYDFGFYDGSSAQKLVILVGGRRDRSSSISIADVTYNGVSCILAVKVSSTNVNIGVVSGIYYLDNPGSAGNIKVFFIGKAWYTGISITILHLSGTLNGHSQTASTSTSNHLSFSSSSRGILLAVSKYSLNSESGSTISSPFTPFSNSKFGSGFFLIPSSYTVEILFNEGDCTAAALFSI